MDRAWENFCANLERRVGAPAVETWVSSGAVKCEYVNGSSVRLRAENRYSYEWVHDNLLGDIRAAWAEVYGHPVEVEFSYEGAAVEGEPRPRPPSRANHLNRTMTFDNFIVGKCNDFAHSAANAVADAPGNAYNPLFIYGGSGLGKTHLMHAIGNEVEQRLGGGVLYLSGQQFFDAMVAALQHKVIHEFRERFRTEVNVLLLDDIQFIAGRDRTEEELFYLFEAMLAAKKQVVLAADQPPQEIGKLSSRLKTRFAQGLIADVQPPDVETMMAILGKKAALLRLVIPNDVQYTIAVAVRNSVRELEGVINRLAAMQSFYGRPITMQFITDLMPELLRGRAQKPTAALIIEKVAEHYHIRASDITGDRKPANIARPRQLAMHLARTLAGLSFPAIATAFSRDNSTVQYACKRVAQELGRDPNLRAELDLLSRTIRGES